MCVVASTTSEAREKGGLLCAAVGWLNGVVSTLAGTSEGHYCDGKTFERVERVCML